MPANSSLAGRRSTSGWRGPDHLYCAPNTAARGAEDPSMTQSDVTARPGAELDLDEFRRAGHAMIEWVADYLAAAERYPVLSRSRSGALTAALPECAPEQG